MSSYCFKDSAQSTKRNRSKKSKIQMIAVENQLCPLSVIHHILSNPTLILISLFISKQLLNKEVIIILISMRPKSAASRRVTHSNRPDQSRYDASLLRTQYLQLNSRIKSTNFQRSEISKISHVKTVNNVKNIGLIHAYKPEMLKKCLVRDKMSYKQFFNKSGDCKAPDIFLKSVITHFREWKKDINERLGLIFDLILQTQPFKEEQSQRKVSQILNDLKGYSQRLKQSLEQLSNVQSESIQVSHLLKKYEEMIFLIKRVIGLVDCLFKFTKEVNLFMAQNDGLDINDMKKLSEQLQLILKTNLNQMVQEMNYCHSQSENEILLKIEYKIRQKMINTNRSNVQILKSIRSMRQFQNLFKTKLESLEKCEVFDCEYLQKVVQFLYFKNEEIKLNEKKFDINPRIKETVYQLRSQIQAIQTNFIHKFRTKCLKEAKSMVLTLDQLRTLDLVKNKGKEYTEIKKKMLLIMKVLQQSDKESGIDQYKFQNDKKVVSSFINSYSNALKNISGPQQSLLERLESSPIFKDRSALKGPRSLEKTIEEILEIEQLQKKVWNVVKILRDELCQYENQVKQDFPQNTYSDSKMLLQLKELLIFTRNEQQNNDIFHLIQQLQQGHPLSSKSRKDDTNHIQQICTFYQSLWKAHQKFAKNGLQQGLIRNNQLKILNREQLVQYLFENQYTSEFISNYPSVKNIIAVMEKLSRFVDKQYINHVQFSLLTCKGLDQYRLLVNQEIKNIEKSKFKGIFNRYIILLYENSLIKLLNLPYILKLQTMRSQSVDTSDYDKIVQRLIEVYQQVLSKTKKEQNLFSQLIFQSYQIATAIHNQNKFILSYYNSVKTGAYFPSFQTFRELIDLQYSVHVEETRSKQSYKMRKEEIKSIFGHSVKKLEAIREKIKMKVILNESHNVYADINQTLALLRSISFEEDYGSLLTKLLTFLRVKKIKHSAIFCQDLNPIYLIPYYQQAEDASIAIYAYLHSSNLTQKRLNLLSRMQFDDSSDHKITESQKASVNFAIQKTADKPLKKQKEVHHVQEEMIEEIEEGQFGESDLKIESNIKQEVIQSFIEQFSQRIEPIDNKPKGNTLNIKSQQKQSQMIQKNQSYSYFIIKSIKSQSVLKKCLFYRNNEHSFIKAKLKLQLLCNTESAEQKKRLYGHIDELMLQVRQSDLIRRMGVDYEEPECQNMLNSFKENVKVGNKTRQALNKLLEYFGFKKEVLYEKGGNKIETIYQANQLPYLNITLVENCYKININEVQIQDFLKYLWKEIKLTLHLNSNTQFSRISAKLAAFVSSANKRLKEHYLQVESELKQKLKSKHANSKQSQEKLSLFMKEVIGSQMVLPAITKQLKSLINVLQIVGQVSQSLQKIKVFQKFHTLHYNKILLYFSGQKIDQGEILMCMMVDKLDMPLDDYRNVNEDNAILNFEKVRESIKRLLKRPELNLVFIKELIDSRKIMEMHVRQQRERLGDLKVKINQMQLLRLIDGQQYGQVRREFQKVEKQIELYKFLQTLSQNPSILPSSTFQTNPHLTYNQKLFQTNTNKQLSPTQLQQLLNLLLQSSIKCYKLQYQSKLLALMNTLSISQAAQTINATNHPSISQYFTVNNDLITISNLKVFINSIVPTYDQSNRQLSDMIQNYLQNTVLQIKIQNTIERFGCYQLYKTKNSLQLQVDETKPPIYLKLVNKHQQIELNIPSNNYLFFIQLQPLIFHQFLREKYQQLKQELDDRQRQLEEMRLQEEMNRELKMREEQKRRAERELEMLQIQQNQLKIKLQNEEMQARMRLLLQQKQRKEAEQEAKRQEEQRRRAKQREEELARLQRQRQKQEQLDQKRKNLVQKLKNKSLHVTNEEGSQLDISVILSEGHSVRHVDEANLMFPGFSKLNQKEQQLQYELTLSQNLHNQKR